MAPPRVLIIGAGLSGLIAARDLTAADGPLDPGQVTVVDKGRGVGGRLATRRIGTTTLDHGAQFFTVRSEAFRRDVDTWLAAGVVEEWCRGFAEVDGYPRYRGAGGMKELARHLGNELITAGVELTTDLRIAALAADDGGWSVTYTDGREPTEAPIVIATPPIPQTVELLTDGSTALDPSATDALTGFSYHKVIALLTVLDRPSDLPEPGALQQPDDPTFSFVADNQAKGISADPAVTFHTAHARSGELWDLDDADVADQLVPAARELLAPAAITEYQVKRWRYSGPVAPHPDPCLVASGSSPAGGPSPLVLAGDAFGGSKVEGAYLSGRAAAAAVAATL